MQPADLLKRLAETLERLGISYLVTGSMATIAFGEPRLTNDIDVVVNLGEDQIDSFCASFPAPEFYLSSDAVRQAVRERRQFNIIHPGSGLKIDVIVPRWTPFERSRQQRGIRVDLGEGSSAQFASPEDVILRKLEYYRAGESEKHLRDIASVIKIQGECLDLNYIADWAARLEVLDLWRTVNQGAKHGDRRQIGL